MNIDPWEEASREHEREARQIAQLFANECSAGVRCPDCETDHEVSRDKQTALATCGHCGHVWHYQP